MKKDTKFWILIAAVAAVIAAVTTVVILLVRARQQVQNLVDPIYDCDCVCYEDEACCDKTAEQCVCAEETKEDTATE